MGKLYLIIALEVIYIFAISIVAFYILKLQFSAINEYRISKYTINLKEKYSLPLYDKLINLCEKIIKNLNRLFAHSEVLKKYSKKYRKYIDYNDKKNREPMDYISLKFISSILFYMLYVITTLNSGFSLMIGLFVFTISYFFPDICLAILYHQKRKRLENDLLEAVIIMNNSFKSGKNILEAIEIVKNEIDGPLKEEFMKIYLDLTHGLDIDVVFNRFYERVKIEDIKYMTSSLTLLNKTGGNIVKVFSSIENNFYDKKSLNEELESLTSSSKLMSKILLGLPIILVILIILLKKDYFSPLYTTKPGIFIILISLILYILYIFAIRKVMRVRLWKKSQ